MTGLDRFLRQAFAKFIQYSRAVCKYRLLLMSHTPGNDTSDMTLKIIHMDLRAFSKFLTPWLLLGKYHRIHKDQHYNTIPVLCIHWAQQMFYLSLVVSFAERRVPTYPWYTSTILNGLTHKNEVSLPNFTDGYTTEWQIVV